MHFFLALPILLFTLLLPLASVSATPQVGGCPIFPADNIWNAPVDELPLAPDSQDFVDSLGGEISLFPDFGAPYLDGFRLIPVGIPFNLVEADQPARDVYFGYAEASDRGPYPIPEKPLIEGVLPGGNPNIDGDRHIIVVDKDNCILYEMFYAWQREDGNWDAGSGAVFDLRSNDLRPKGKISADGGGLPILPGLVRYEEVADGEIHHAIRFTARNHKIRRGYVWPARHRVSGSRDEKLPPIGQRFRLKSDFDISGFSRDMQVILRAMKRYGLILADYGEDWSISGTSDDRWDNDQLIDEFSRIRGEDFEAVDVSSLVVSDDSAQANDYVAVSKAPAGKINWYTLLVEK